MYYRSPDPDAVDAKIPINKLPKCSKCSGLLRPNVVWFGEALDPEVLRRTNEELDKCDLCLLVSSYTCTKLLYTYVLVGWHIFCCISSCWICSSLSI